MKFTSSLILFLYLSRIAFSQGITLQEALALAQKNNPSVQAASLAVRKQVLLKRTAFDLPKTNVSLMAGQYNSINKADNNLSISHDIPFPTVFTSHHGLAKSIVESASLQETITKNELAFQVKDLINQFIYTKALSTILFRHDSMLANLVRATQFQYSTGEGTLLSKTSVETQWLDIQNKRKRNEIDLLQLLQQIQLICQAADISDINASLETLVDIVDAKSFDPTHNPALAFTQQQIQISNWQRKTEIARMFPDITVGYFNQTLIGTQTVNGQDQYFGSNSRFHGFQLGLSIPLWIGPSLAKIKASTLAVDITQKQHESASLQLSQRYNQALANVEKNKSSIEFYQRSALPSAQLLLAQSKRAFTQGEVDYPAFLLNLRQALSIEEEYLHAWQQYNQSIIILQYLNGVN